MEFLIVVGSTTIAAIIGAYLLLRAEKKEREMA
jgi:hypothetical protein